MRTLAILPALLLALGASAGARAQDVDGLFALVDGNHDNVVDRAEADAFSELRWAAMDRRHAGTVSAETIASDPLSRLFVGDLMPAPGGTLSHDAFIAALRRRFQLADAAGAGALDPGAFRVYISGPAAAQPVALTPLPMLPSLADPYPAGLPGCEAMASDPRFGLAGAKGVSSPVARKIKANAKDAAYCQLQFVYNSGLSGPKDGYDDGQSQAITIRVGLPLRPDDGGTVGWNGRIQDLGSGGCMGVLPNVMVATNSGFAGSSSDGGHGAPYLLFNCGFGVIQDKHQLNAGLIRDFSAEHVKWQTRWTKTLVQAYYGQPAKRSYWCGCSQGGREAYIAMQTIPEEHDGILAGAGALYWMRFQMAQAWSGVVIKDTLRSKGKDLTGNEIARTVSQEIAGCDMLDGVKDGVIGDPRACHWSAGAVVCGTAGAPPAGQCLDADQAGAFDLIRRGPHNSKGDKIWFQWEPGTTFPSETDYLLSDGIMQWAVHDLTFSSDAHVYLDQAALERSGDRQGITYEDMATLATQRVSDVADVSDSALDAAAKSGVKVIAWTGTADRNIFSRDTIKYYRDVAAHLHEAIDDPALQDWYRVFLYPGVGHCAGGDGPQPGNVYNGALFQALVNWVENGKAPNAILASTPAGAGSPARTRPVCPYPKTAIYNGAGSIDDAANFTCGGNLETPEIVAADALAPLKKENGTGAIPANYQ